jgi:hypothetical protein
MNKFALLLCLFLATYGGSAQTYKALFDQSKGEDAGNADWVIDDNMPVPSPAQSGITSSTTQTYWTGAISAWGVDLVKRAFTVHTLTSTYGITYGNSSNPYDLSNYNLFVVCEPNILFTTTEKAAIKSFVQNGGGLMMVADHDGSDRNSDGYDSPKIWNDLRTDSLFGIHFQSTGETNNNITQVATNVATGNDLLIQGADGTVLSVSYHNGTTMNILPAVNPNAAGHIWMNNATHGNSQIMFATSKYGLGKVAGVGDSSPADDGSARPGNSSIYNGWGEVGATDSIVFLNACMWLVTPDTTASNFTITASAGSNGSISPSGSVSLSSGGSQAFTIGASTGYHIDSVFVDGVNQGAVSGFTFTNVTANHSIRAVFRINQYQIIATAGSNGSIGPSGTTTINYGGSQTYNFIPATGYHVDSLIVDGVKQTSAASYAFSNVTANHMIRVSFLINTYTIIATTGANGSITPSGSINITYGGNQGFILTPDTGYQVADVIVDGSSVGAVASYNFPGVFANHTISVSFSIIQFIITASVSGNGTINPSGPVPVNYGADASFDATPAVGYHIDSLVVDGLSEAGAGGQSSYHYVFRSVNASHTIGAFFGINTYTLTVNANGGSVTRQPDVPVYTYGQVVQLTPHPLAGYDFSAWSGDVPVGHESDIPLSLTIDSNTTVTANFNHGAFILTIVGDHGTVSRNPNQASYDSGTTVQLMAMPSAGYHFGNWSGDASGTTNPLSILMDSPKTLTALFLSDSSNIIASAGLNGAIDPEGSVPVAGGAAQRFSFLPVSGYQTDSVIVDDTVIADSVSGYTFDSVTTNHTIHVSFKRSITSARVLKILGWNLISLPVIVVDSRMQSVFPSAASQAYMYDGQYTPSDSLRPGTGYWAKFPNAGDTIATGMVIAAESIQVKVGWNLIGSISAPVQSATIISDPPNITTGQFFGYNRGYVPADTLYPAKGYWVKSAQDGILILAANSFYGTSHATQSRIKIVVNSEMPPPPPAEASSSKPALPKEFALDQAYPNPFNPSTTISYSLPVESNVSIRVYTVMGQEVAVLVNETQKAGTKQVEWNASALASGAYYYRLEASGIGEPARAFSQVRKVLLVK